MSVENLENEVIKAAESHPLWEELTKDASDSRKVSLALAIQAGADEKLLKKLSKAVRLSRKDTIILPAVRFENLSRGRGWCRCGFGEEATWGERVSTGYLVSEGRWTVFGTDGFKRSDRINWTVYHVKVGDMIWTIAK